MFPISTIEGLLFRSYLTRYNLSLLHRCIREASDEYTDANFRKAAMSHSALDLDRKVSRAATLTEATLAYCRKNNIALLPYFDAHYPKSLLALKDFPPILFVKGFLPTDACVAVVGSRNTSPIAPEKTMAVVKAIKQNQLGVISGLALGIDSMAHRAAVYENVYTAAVLPTFPDRIYPPQNITLANEILEMGGALISEQAPNGAPVANPFVMRNRIIAALASTMIPVEMGKDSGTRHAVHYAVKQNRKVILLKPGVKEIDQYLQFYEGILLAQKKYRQKPGVVVVNSMDAITTHLHTKPTDMQPRLFS